MYSKEIMESEHRKCKKQAENNLYPSCGALHCCADSRYGKPAQKDKWRVNAMNDRNLQGFRRWETRRRAWDVASPSGLSLTFHWKVKKKVLVKFSFKFMSFHALRSYSITSPVYVTQPAIWPSSALRSIWRISFCFTRLIKPFFPHRLPFPFAKRRSTYIVKWFIKILIKAKYFIA